MAFAKSDRLSNNFIIRFVKGLIVSMLISFGLIILLAFCLKWFSFDEKYISPLNLAIKTISVLVGSSIAIKGESKGLLQGVGFGLLYIIVAFLSFSFLAKTFAMDLSFLLDVVFACLAGGLVGIIKVNKWQILIKLANIGKNIGYKSYKNEK